ncbi:MAG: double-strand break repair helicase AddA [Erythrobacter sp.]
MSGDVYPLHDNQGKAVDPRESVWLSASAGTGKTQVLSARVLRLLLQPGTDPSQILCLTFTKAGAAEMAVRINDVLARWVRLDGPKLAKELGYLGADIGPETQARARTLFASVLDCPGGGLRIDTIHAFSQWLLANFPNEAGLIPGARPIEDRERDLLMRETLSEMLQDAGRDNDQQTLEAVGEYSRRKGPDALQEWLMRCAKLHDLWFGAGAWQAPMLPQVLQLLGVPSDADAAWVNDVLSPEVFPDDHILAMIPALEDWGTAIAQKCLAVMRPWLSLDEEARISAHSDFYGTLLNAGGAPSGHLNRLRENGEGFAESHDMVASSIAMYEERQALLDFAHFLAPSLELGRAFALRWDKAKQAEGLLDFDDLIQRAADLLSKRVSAEWIRFKLDRQFDHILVDEAQDTNAPQWAIIDALIDDFFSGEGARGDTLRTIFTVGDYKQAIFGFQGTSPENFRKAKERVASAMRQASENAQGMRRPNAPGILQDLDLGRSFRTSMPVLNFVNRTIAALGWNALGLDEAPSEHIGDDGPGLVTLWQPVRGEDALDNSDARDDGEKGEKGAENWLAKHDRLMADKIARQVQQWMNDAPFILSEKGKTRAATPGDVMVLVRSRKDLAALIVARLHAKGVPVAGVDRLRLGAPLAVKDIMAAVRFAAQPLDDLNLANLLSSPLIGWSQDDILDFVPRAKGKRLWDHLRKLDNPAAQQGIEKLKNILNLADFETPQALLQWILVGPWQGRAKLIARLGREANDPIDELLNAAFTYEAGNTPSLAGFIRWFDAGEAELKRDPGENADLVRVMTVHGSKGLEAPIVILADATGEPGRVRDLALDETLPGGEESSDPRAIPVPPLSASDQKGRVAEAHDAAKMVELQEHWRLLYVAMTRAKQALFIGGSLSQRAKAPPEDSWYARLEALFDPDSGLEDGVFGARFELGERAQHSGKSDTIDDAGALQRPPTWAVTPIGPEPRPPRPLAPSSSGEDHSSDPPLPAELVQSAARRGVLIHSLLERLPDVEPSSREDAATQWLARQASDLDDAARAEILASAMQVIADPDFVQVFSANALAEVPLAAKVGGEVISGIADRLLITPDAITVVDFKTARRPPMALASIPQSTTKQMAAYVCALEVIYPGRAVRAAVLYTQTPKLFTLTDEMLGQHKQAFVQG